MIHNIYKTRHQIMHDDFQLEQGKLITMMKASVNVVNFHIKNGLEPAQPRSITSVGAGHSVLNTEFKHILQSHKQTYQLHESIPTTPCQYQCS